MARNPFTRPLMRHRRTRRTESAQLEPLESRRLMSVTVASVVADDRGEVILTLTDSADASTVNKNSVQMYTAGADGILGTADDARVPASVRYNDSSHRITILGQTAAEQAYRVKLVASRMLDDDGDMLDGDYSGTFPAGNQAAGGNFEFVANPDKSVHPQVRMSSSAGVITVKLDRGDTPLTTANFIDYADSGLYDNTIIHRDGRTDYVSGPLGIIQGGGYTDTDVDDAGNPTDHIPTFNPIPLEAGLPNRPGTIAMARLSDNPNSATSEFFFNTANNTFLNPVGPGTGYAVFGSVTSSSGMSVINTVYNAPTIAPHAAFDAVPQLDGQDVIFTRVAVLMKVSTLAVPIISPVHSKH